MRLILGLSVTVLGVVLSGCGPRGEQVMIQNARGTAYSQGYGDGCATARAELGIAEAVARKDVKRMLTSLQYKNGWEAGYDECKFREEKVAKLSMSHQIENVKIGNE